jgi:hypothetical protein
MASDHTIELARRGQALYERRLRAILEESHLNEYVAIEPESGEYFLGHTVSEAIQAARATHPDRLPFVLRVGHRTTVDIGATNL